MNDLQWIIESGDSEIEYYLENVTRKQFVLDVKELMKKQVNELMKKQVEKTVIEDTIKRLQELL
jgi:translation initiation factor RLI1